MESLSHYETFPVFLDLNCPRCPSLQQTTISTKEIRARSLVVQPVLYSDGPIF